jgi:hypothetical protein
MKNKLRSAKRGSKSASISQPQTPQDKAPVPSPKPGQVPRGLLPFDPSEDSPSCLCVFDRVAGDVVSQIPLSNDEYIATVLEGARLDIPFERWIADAIREKLRSSRGEAPSHPGAGAGAEDPPPMSKDEADAYAAMREHKLRSPLEIGLEMIGYGDQPDSRLAEYLAGIIRDFAPDLWTHVISQLDDREAAYFGEVIALAEDVAHYYAVLDHGEKDTYDSRPFPRSFSLPGYANYQILNDPGDVLFYLADSLNRNREAILERILEPEQDRVGRLELVEALVIAQAVMDRAGGDDEIENCERTHTYTRLVQLSWKIKAEYYAAKLRLQAAARETAIAKDEAMFPRPAAA